MKVLVVEDAVGVPILKVLQKIGYEVLLAEEAEEAWAILNDTQINLFLIDWILPGISGLDLVRKIRQVPQYKNTPVIMISGRSERADITTAMDAGVDSYIAKPFTALQLRDKIIGVLQQADKNPRREKMHRFCQGQANTLRESAEPLIVLVEAANTPERLTQTRMETVAAYLQRFSEAVGLVNDERTTAPLGYIIEERTKDVINRLRKNDVRKRIKLILVASDCGGNSYLLMRLLKVNRRSQVPAILICDDMASIPMSQLQLLEALDVDIRPRRELDVHTLHRLIAGALSDEKRSLGAPSIARRYLLADLESTQSLPPAPSVYARIARLAADDDSEMQLWSEAVESDPALSSLVVRHARSPTYGFREDITAVARAVVLLGKETVEHLALTETAKRAFLTIGESNFSLNAFWLHNLATAFAAHLLAFPYQSEDWNDNQRSEVARFKIAPGNLEYLRRLDLSKRLNIGDAKLPFRSGLMHDIGKVVMVQAYPDLYPLILEKMRETDWSISMRDAERDTTGGITHEEVGEVLVQKWDLGHRVSRVVGHHHSADSGDPCAFLLAVADLCAHAVYTFPLEAQFPIKDNLAQGTFLKMAPFLPDHFAAQSYLTEKELPELLAVIAPAVRRLTDQLRTHLTGA